MSTSILKALPGKLDINRHSPSILYILLYCCKFLTLSNLISSYNTASASEYLNILSGTEIGLFYFYYKYSKTCLKRPLKNQQNKGCKDEL